MRGDQMATTRLPSPLLHAGQRRDCMSDAATFFTDGAAYERMMGRWSRLVGEPFLDWVDVPAGVRWLDVGCGNGAFTETLVSRCSPASVMAIDPSGGQIAYARTRPGVEMAQFQLADAQTLPFGDDAFDAAVMALVISFVPEPIKAVVEMARVVRPGGYVATYMWDLLGGGAPVAPIYAAVKSLGIAPPLPVRSDVSGRDALQDLWKQAGLESIETRVIRVPIVYADFDDFWASNAVPSGPQGQLIHSMSPDERERLRARLRELLPAGSDGRIVFESYANAVKGRTRG
jgi:SAM-dependent methyltransferase